MENAFILEESPAARLSAWNHELTELLAKLCGRAAEGRATAWKYLLSYLPLCFQRELRGRGKGIGVGNCMGVAYGFSTGLWARRGGETVNRAQRARRAVSAIAGDSTERGK